MVSEPVEFSADSSMEDEDWTGEESEALEKMKQSLTSCIHETRSANEEMKRDRVEIKQRMSRIEAMIASLIAEGKSAEIPTRSQEIDDAPVDGSSAPSMDPSGQLKSGQLNESMEDEEENIPLQALEESPKLIIDDLVDPALAKGIPNLTAHQVIDELSTPTAPKPDHLDSPRTEETSMMQLQIGSNQALDGRPLLMDCKRIGISDDLPEETDVSTQSNKLSAGNSPVDLVTDLENDCVTTKGNDESLSFDPGGVCLMVDNYGLLWDSPKPRGDGSILAKDLTNSPVHQVFDKSSAPTSCLQMDSSGNFSIDRADFLDHDLENVQVATVDGMELLLFDPGEELIISEIGEVSLVEYRNELSLIKRKPVLDLPMLIHDGNKMLMGLEIVELMYDRHSLNLRVVTPKDLIGEGIEVVLVFDPGGGELQVVNKERYNIVRKMNLHVTYEGLIFAKSFEAHLYCISRNQFVPLPLELDEAKLSSGHLVMFEWEGELMSTEKKGTYIVVYDEEIFAPVLDVRSISTKKKKALALATTTLVASTTREGSVTVFDFDPGGKLGRAKVLKNKLTKPADEIHRMGCWCYIDFERILCLVMLRGFLIMLISTFQQYMDITSMNKMRLHWREQGVLESCTRNANVSFQGKFGGAVVMGNTITETLAPDFWSLKVLGIVCPWDIQATSFFFDPGGKCRKLADEVHSTSC